MRGQNLSAEVGKQRSCDTETAEHLQPQMREAVW